MKRITTCNWWGYIKLRIEFRRNCQDKEAQHIEKYKYPNRYLFCEKHRAVLTRYGNVWDKHQPVYVSTFCAIEKCDFRGTCIHCKHNLNNKE